MEFGIAGAGFSGAVVARELAEAGHRAHVFERRDHVAGNCHTERHPTGVLVHRYGPHIFHTDNERVWRYITRFADMVPYRLRVRTTYNGRVYPLPVNLHTINQFYATALGPAAAREFIAARVEPIAAPATFEDVALATVGRDLYDAFFRGYTRKQWGRDPADLPASVFRRLPVRFDYDDAYFDDPHQAIPRDGYTALVEAVLDHPRIDVHLGTAYSPRVAGLDHTVWTGPLDAWFDHEYGRLGYRTLDFEEFVGDGDHQGCALMNYGDFDVPWTRVSEHRHFAPWEQHARTVCFREYSREAEPSDEPFYPVRLAHDKEVLGRYLAAAGRERDVTFVGRLATYRYLDMDDAIAAALTAAGRILDAVAERDTIPAMVHNDPAATRG